MESVQPLALIILDGWGLGPDPKADAIATAQTPFFDSLQTDYPHATLNTFGEHVGLPEGQMGNSEVGHLNLGAGRVVFQELVRINQSIKDGSLAGNPALIEAFDRAKNSGRPLHLLGLISDGGVHSHIDHLTALCTMAHEAGVPKVLIHGFMDGRDTDPKGGIGYIRDLEQHLQSLSGIKIASLIGRYYAMDRDQRWSRIARAHHLLTLGQGIGFPNAEEALASSYAQGVTDEFLEPCRIGMTDALTENVIRPDDVVLFFNFRTDRPRQLLRALAIEAFPEEDMAPMPLHVYSMTRYDQRFDKVRVLLEKQDLGQTLGEVISKAGLTQLRIAETEKYAHVTYFFGGGREEPFPGEERIMIPSPSVATYDLQPEMSAEGVADAAIAFIQTNKPHFICLNFANTDMVGHTGIFQAAVKAAETVDGCLQRLIPAALKQGYDLIILADHGNADVMVNADGSPHTSHTMSPVPLIYISGRAQKVTLKSGKLADIAPTILHIMGIDIPPVMGGEVLVHP